ncbi:type II toxin-antitoxin system VapB family antitoxin [Aerophototrophica crusticola]|uniref:Type II toxin-antitoxin system VapB family antitoxin n=1 Tax=Aerophototrophica crusticola TaxID=1709002 RepID=A0A858RB68_9PROT|nr:type II toxin-antitoxin system VapB family antitoxin [Rhodospirillaceae bacterium B3]
MRPNIDLDETFMADLMAATGEASADAAVLTALRRVVDLHRQGAAIRELQGIGWDGDLEEMRTDWGPDRDWGLR